MHIFNFLELACSVCYKFLVQYCTYYIKICLLYFTKFLHLEYCNFVMKLTSIICMDNAISVMVATKLIHFFVGEKKNKKDK